MAFAFNWDSKPENIAVFVKVDGKTEKYHVGTSDHQEARQEVIRALNNGFRSHGAVLSLVK